MNIGLNFAQMELFLNLVWLAIATGALLTYFWQSVAGRSRFHLRLGALACALVFLLPAISITDDLHSDTFAVEDASLGKRVVQAAARADLISHVSWLHISFWSPLATRPPRTGRHHIVATIDFLPALLFTQHLPERAPPCSLC